MKVTINQVKISNFKGCKELNLNLGSVNEVKGVNGVGKTTIATAWLWLMSDRDYSLKSNPSIFPLNVEECTPRVEFLITVDKTELRLAKSQQRIRKSTNKATFSNTYEINSVSYGERDFRDKLSEYGIEFDLFLPLSHIDVFTSQKTNDMRKVLFSMTNKKSDLEIAKGLKNCKDVQNLLEIYTMEEIKAMQQATVKDITKNYGKTGEILRAKIEGLESAKVDVDVAEYELGKKAIQEMLDSNKRKQEEILKEYQTLDKMSDGILELNFKLSDLQRKDKLDKDKKREKIRGEISELEKDILANELVIRDAENGITQLKTRLVMIDNNLKAVREQHNNAKKLVFDDKSCLCKLCGQEYPSRKKTKIKAEFERRKEKEIADTLEKNNTYVNLKIKTNEELGSEEFIKSQVENTVVRLRKKRDRYQDKLDKVKELDITTTKEYKKIQDKKKALEKANDIDKRLRELRTEEINLNSKMAEVMIRITKSINNDIIDEKIDELKKLQLEYEQKKANCEKVLYQIDLINRKKNELLTDDINSHFKLVDFKLFDYRKNGDYLECCVSSYKGKDLNVDTNTGLEMLMKLDIIKGLQKFYDLKLPVFIDCAESLSDETKKLIDMNCQVTYLTVSQNSKLSVNGQEV